MVVLIENKIFASVGNPFADYSAHVERLTSDGRAVLKILLTLFPTEDGGEWGFVNLTYSEFVAEIQARLGRCVTGADTRYLTIFVDFLNTLENLQEETRMDESFVKLLSERSEEVESLLAGIQTFKDELRRKVRELATYIDVEGYGNVRQWFYREKTNLHDCLVHDILVVGDVPIAVDATLYPQEWEISFNPRRKTDYQRVKALLQDLGIPFHEDEVFVHPDHFDYGEDPNHIKTTLQELVDKLAMTEPERESR